MFTPYICPQGELGEAECEQALSTLFHVLFTMARMMVCGGGSGEGTWVWGGEGGAHGCVGVEGEGQTGVEGEGQTGVEGEGQTGVEGGRGRGRWVCRGGGGGADGCVGVEG